MLVQSEKSARPQDVLAVTSSVKLRRKTIMAEADSSKKRNRYSGGDFLIGSPARGQVLSQPLRGHEVMRKSGDWSYVGFPSAKSPPVTPKLSQRPLSYQQQPVSMLESRVLASIIHNEATRGRGGHRSSKSTHGTPVALQKSQYTTDYSSLGSEARSVASAASTSSRLLEEAGLTSEEYTKLLRRRMISEVLKPAPTDIWQRQQPQPQPQQQPQKKRRSRSQSGQRKADKNETQSEVNLRKPGLGRRSATQLELSRRKKDDEGLLSQKARWHSQEHLDTATSTPLLGLGNFAGGRKELAQRLLSQEENNKNNAATSEDCILSHRVASMPPNPMKMMSNGKKGILWQQRDKIFSRWKERFFVLTQDYLQCFKKGSSRITEMGGFIYGIRLAEISDVQLLDKRGYLTICLNLAAKDGKLYLRRPEGIRDWYQSLKASIQTCRDRRSMLSTEEFWSRKHLADSTNIEQWLTARQRVGVQYSGNFSSGSPSHTWELDDGEEDVIMASRRCRSPKSAPSSRPQSTTRSSSRPPPTRRSLSQHPNPSNMGVEHVYETPKHDSSDVVVVTSPSSSARSSRLSAGSNGFFRDSGNDSMYTSSGGSTDSSNREQRRLSEAHRVSSSKLDMNSASSTPQKLPYHRHLPSQATRV